MKDYAFYPIRHQSLIEHYWEQRNIRWVPQDIDLKCDKSEWKNNSKCDENVKNLVVGILSFFVPSDGMVTENIFFNFQQDTSIYKEAVAFYAEQAAMEMVHSETYSLMAESIITDSDTRYKIYNSFDTFKSVEKIAKFMTKYMGRDKSLPIRIVAFACVEGILFNSAFACIHWVKHWRNILPGFCKANEFIARDEAIHTRFACELFKTILENEKEHTRPTKEEFYNVIDEAVELNKVFINEILPEADNLIGLSSEGLIKYTKCTADILCTWMGYDKKYNESNPFAWMKLISLPNRTNFFESRVSEYAKPESGENEFDLDEDF